MSLIETVYLIASPINVDALLVAVDVLTVAGYVAPSPADYPDMAAMCNALVEADAVVLVDGWETCPAAQVEVSIAAALGKPVLTMPDLLPLAA